MFAVMYKLKAIKENLKSTALKAMTISAMLIFLKRKTKTTIEIRPKKIIFLNLFILSQNKSKSRTFAEHAGANAKWQEKTCQNPVFNIKDRT